LGCVAEIFPLEGLKFSQHRLQIARGRHLCNFVDRVLTELERFFLKQGIFYICAISVQTSPK